MGLCRVVSACQGGWLLAPSCCVPAELLSGLCWLPGALGKASLESVHPSVRRKPGWRQPFEQGLLWQGKGRWLESRREEIQASCKEDISSREGGGTLALAPAEVPCPIPLQALCSS